MVTFNEFIELNRLSRANALYNRIVKLSELHFREDNLSDTSDFIKQAQRLLEVGRSADTIIGIFDHRTWIPIIELGADEFWGPIPGTKEDRIKTILSFLGDGYQSFPIDSVRWQINVLDEIPFSQRVNFRFYHCGIRYELPNKKQINLFSQGVPFQYDSLRNFSYTFNYVQNVSHLIKKDFNSYWIRMSFGENNEFVRTFYGATKEYSKRDLLSNREKEILLLIAQDTPTKDIADQLSISTNTVSNHRSNMIERLGVRDTTALVQIAKMVSMI